MKLKKIPNLCFSVLFRIIKMHASVYLILMCKHDDNEWVCSNDEICVYRLWLSKMCWEWLSYVVYDCWLKKGKHVRTRENQYLCEFWAYDWSICMSIQLFFVSVFLWLHNSLEIALYLIETTLMHILIWRWLKH